MSLEKAGVNVDSTSWLKSAGAKTLTRGSEDDTAAGSQLASVAA